MELLLAIDGSTKATGWSIFDMDSKSLIKYGVIKVDPKEEKDTRVRIIHMVEGLTEIFEKYEIDEVIMEDVPPSMQNAVTVKMLGMLQGGVIGLCHTYGVQVDIDNFILPNVWHSDLKILKSKGDLKEQSVNLANELLGTNFIYKSKTSKFNEDDISDSALIGYWKLNREMLKQEKVAFKRKR